MESPQGLAMQISEALERKGSASTTEFGEASQRLGEIDNELAAARKARDELQEELNRLDAIATVDVGDMPPIVTEFTAEIEELKEQISLMTDQLRAQAEENDAILEEVRLARV